MKFVLTAILVCLTICTVDAQKRRPAAVRSREIGQMAYVIDETLSVLRPKPSLFAMPMQRMRRGRVVKIMGVAEADGVKFYRVSAIPTGSGWVQADAVFGKFREDDDARLARLVQSMSGFDQIETATEFFTLFPTSQFRAPILLLYGDLLEDAAAKLSRDATRQLSRPEMAASAAPLHSYYLNYVSLDRYRRIGITFLFNPSTKQFHYDGASWKELVLKHKNTNEAAEAQKRLDSLKEKLAKQLETRN
ncbi:MAG TPA: hypothetical protein PLK77_18605 [Pyrinomonadaceae bacterium]|nr:hypothetical protein [Pyrinomonadaceae bacterium]